MHARNAIAIFYVAASLSTAVAWAKDEGFRYHQSTGQCINSKGELGLNKGHFGECGDIPGIKLFRKRKIKKAELSYVNLRGIQLNGLDLSSKNFAGSDLTGANLIGSKLNFANLNGATLTNAKFSENTELPFDTQEALNRGMINIDFNGNVPVNDNFLNDILTSDDLETLSRQFAEIRRPQQVYHMRLQRVFDSAESLTADQLHAFMSAAFSQQEAVNALYDQIIENSNSERPDEELARRLMDEFQQQQIWSSLANNILFSGMQGKMELKKLPFADALRLASRAIPFSNSPLPDNIFYHLKSQFEISSETDLSNFVAAAINSGANEAAADQVIALLNLRGELSVEALIEAQEEFYSKRPKALGAMFAKGISKLETISAAQILTLAAQAPEDKSAIVYAGIDKVEELDAAQALSLLAISSYSSKDKVLSKYFALNTEVSLEHFVRLIREAYQNANNLIAGNLGKIKDLTPQQAVQVIGLASYSGRDQAAHVYLSLLGDNSLTSNELAAIAAAAYQNGNNLLVQHLHKLSDLNAKGIKKLADTASYSGKDAVINRYLKDLEGSATTDEIIALANAAYQNHNNFLSNYLTSITDLSPRNAARIAAAASYSGKDSVINNYLHSNPSLKTVELIALAAQSYQNGNSFLLSGYELLNDLSIDTAIQLAKAASYSTKDQILSKYINATQRLSAQDLIKLARESYQSGTNLVMHNLGKVAPFNYDAVLFLVSSLSYGNKDTVIKRFTDQETSLTTAQILKLAEVSYGNSTQIKVGLLDKISDLNFSNVRSLAAALSYNNKDLVLNYYLNKVSTLKTAELRTIAADSYQNARTFITNNLAKVSDLTVANALTLKGAFSYGALDSYLLQALELVTDLNQENLLALANQAYQQKERILTRGMAILLGQQN